ncbi:hypothetical protein BST11_12070 [Mycobacterium alsense]|uniref:Uncharacterized protein n=1 Tax=Mycobacterium alsense TaxID=324058 RepID=A0AA42C2A2_9MYCO|nr:hypothetical protein [Mycobacterium alsense]MCV7381294.1 hypothetical protein [Mycobacterium alsense]OQZ90681.1 hypothetical protein BST11_12070 [Mycobacterium alsense]
MADDELDSLYWARPDAFTARRAELAAAAKERGDAAAAKRISATRKPTTAAWVVNRLALRHHDAPKRLTDLGERLRAAHAEMDGERIRELSAEQHRLIANLTRAAFDAAEVKRPSASVREDVTGTLQAAVADPGVAKRLGRLAKPEQWSGFGFGEAAPAKGRSGARSKPPARDRAAERHRETLEAAKKVLADAERAKAKADDAVRRAEREYRRADDNLDRAKRAGRAAAETVKQAKQQLRRV